MKRVLIGVLLVFLATSYIVQREHILKKLSAPITERMQPVPVVVEKHRPRQQDKQVELLAYPPPDDMPVLPYPPPVSPIRTELPTPDLGPTPTFAPTMTPWGD